MKPEAIEPKTVNQYLEKFLSIHSDQRAPEATELIELLQRLKFDHGGNKILRTMVSKVYWNSIRRVLNLSESE